MFKKIITALFLGLVITTLFTTYSSAASAESVKDSVLRLHIVANSDSARDQEIKYAVRDAIVAESDGLFGESTDKKTAIRQIGLRLEEIEDIARGVLKEYGCADTVTAEVVECFFPTKEYETGVRLPAGFYDALRITIGAGEGKNWWCILYPPLCFGGSVDDGTEALEPALSEEEIDMVTVDPEPKVEVKFKLAELWGKIVEFFRGGK